MGARGDAMIVRARPVTRSRCPSTSRFSRLSTGPSLSRSSGSHWRSFAINLTQLARTGVTAKGAASSMTGFVALRRFRRSAMSRSSTPTLRLTAHRYRPMRRFFSRAGRRRGGGDADVTLLRGPRFIARRHRSSAHNAVPRCSQNGDARDASDGGRDAGVVAVGDDQHGASKNSRRARIWRQPRANGSMWRRRPRFLPNARHVASLFACWGRRLRLRRCFPSCAVAA